MFHLRIFDGQHQQVRVEEVRTRSVKLGRSTTCDIVLPSPYVSREHALIRVEDGRFVLEAVGMNPSFVAGQEVTASQSLPVRPHDEIRIAEYTIFIEAPETKSAEDFDVSRELAKLELELHAQLLERVDLTGTDHADNQRMQNVLEELVRARVPDASSGAPAEVVSHALRETMYCEIVQEAMRRTAGNDAAQRIGGWTAMLDDMMGNVVREFCAKIGISGERGKLRSDLRLIDAKFPTLFVAFESQASDQVRTLFVQRFLQREILNLVCGFGPLQDLLELPSVSEIMVIHKDLIYVERDGELERLHRTFITDEILLSVIQRIVEPLGRRIDRSTPLVDARLPDGSRVNAVIPPLAVKGPCLTIRMFSKEPLTMDDLISFGSLTAQAAGFLQACVRGHRNVVVSGGTGSGKTTLLNILSGYIGEGERILTIEDSAELQLRQPHVVTLETRPANVEGKGAYTIRDLVKNALRMRPDRIVVGECRGGEALDMLQAMNTGHDGSLTTLHANNPKDALLRLETMVLQAVDLPVRAIRDQITAAVHIIIQASRLPSGKRMVTHISEVVGIDPESGSVLTNDIFEEREQQLHFSGYLPSFMQQLVNESYLDPHALFEADAADEAEVRTEA